MLEFQAHICWVITVDHKVRLGQVKSEFDWKSPKLTRSVRASKLSMFPTKSYSVLSNKSGGGNQALVAPEGKCHIESSYPEMEIYDP